jgi:hypothetical protein
MRQKRHTGVQSFESFAIKKAKYKHKRPYSQKWDVARHVGT